MRQPLKPFSVETRSNGRRKTQPPAAKSLAPAIGAGRDLFKSDAYDAALRAADVLFGSSSVEPERTQAPPSELDMQALSSGETRIPGRILRALDEPVVTVEADQRIPARRGRPPGSKNKVVRPPRLAAAKEATPNALVPSADDLIASLFGDDKSEADRSIVTPIVYLPPERSERVRFSWIDRELGPGERWKRRLSRICW